MTRDQLPIKEQQDPSIRYRHGVVHLNKEGDFGPCSGREGEGSSGEGGPVLVVAEDGGGGAEVVRGGDVGVDCAREGKMSALSGEREGCTGRSREGDGDRPSPSPPVRNISLAE